VDAAAGAAVAEAEPLSSPMELEGSPLPTAEGEENTGPESSPPDGSPPDGSPLSSPTGEGEGPECSPLSIPTEPAVPAEIVPPAPIDHDAEIVAAAEQRAVLVTAINVVKEVCEEIGRAAKVKMAQEAQGAVASAMPSGMTVHAEYLAKAAAEEKWKSMLDENMKELKNNRLIVGVFKLAVHQDFDVERADLRQLTAVQVRAVRTELVRLEKLWQITQALAVANAVVHSITNASEEEPEAWKSKLEEGLKDLRLSEDLKITLKNVAPDLVAADADAEQWNIVSLTALTVEQVRSLQEDLSKLRSIKEAPTSKPRALVKAMQALYQAETLAEAELTLMPETADEEAMRQLTERSQEFAPALAAMRRVAVDHEVFAHLAEVEEEGGDEVFTESEASDVEKDLVGRKEPAPVVLPPGWHLEWVKRKKKEAREFVDPAGNRYISINEVRRALAEWEARGGALAQMPDAPDAEVTLEGPGGYGAVSASDAFGWGGEGTKRRRLHGKTSRASTIEIKEDFFEGTAEDAFADMLDMDGFADVLGQAPAPAAPVAAETSSMGSTPNANRPTARPGLRVVLHSLQAKPELNGKFARICQFLEDTGRWELVLEPGAAADRANVKQTNFTVLPAVQQSAPPIRKRLTGKTNVAALAAKRPREAPTDASAASNAKPAVRRKGSTPVLAAGQPSTLDDESD